MEDSEADSEEALVQSASYLFAPLDKRAFGTAIGLVSAISVLVVTAVSVMVAPDPSPLRLLAQYFAGYSVSWTGAIVGAAWGFATGFVAGWFVAFVRNLVLAVSLFILGSRAELTESRDFLDYI